MNLDDVLKSSLELDKEYQIDRIEVEENYKEIHVYIERAINEVYCPTCNETCMVHDRMNKKWRHIDFAEYRVYVVHKIPRIKCQEHGVKQTVVGWAKPRHAFTDKMEDFIYDLSNKIPLVHIGNLVGEHDTRIKRIVKSKGE